MAADIRLEETRVVVEGGGLRVDGGGIEAVRDLTVPVKTGTLSPQGYTTEMTAVGDELFRLRNTVEAIREQLEVVNLLAAIRAEAAHYTHEGFRYCVKCSNLHYAPNLSRSVCPKDKKPHDVTGSLSYILFPHASKYQGQNGWKWCRRCQGVGHGTAPLSGHCPAGSAHDRSASPDYILWADSYPAKSFNAQSEWRWCNRCYGLCHQSNPGVCPHPESGPHNYAGSGNYHIMH
jgi:hypothetical protein